MAQLTLCIPTYNRAALLEQALESIVGQAGDAVEIVVSDNGSTDATRAVMERFAARFPRLTYFRQPENLGFDRNMLKAVELARGEYCWLFGSDDALAPDALARVLPLLGEADVLVLDRINMSLDFARSLGVERMLAAPPGTRYQCGDQAQLLRYFDDANSIGGMFSYISGLIVRRALWNAAGTQDAFVGSGYIHVAKMLAVVNRGATVLYPGAALVLNRTGNDELQRDVGYTRRRLTDLNFGDIAAAVFAERPAVRDRIVARLARQFFNLRTLLSDKRSAYRADGAAAPGRLLERYRTLFRREPGYRFKLAAWYLMNPALLDFARRLFGRQPERGQA